MNDHTDIKKTCFARHNETTHVSDKKWFWCMMISCVLLRLDKLVDRYCMYYTIVIILHFKTNIVIIACSQQIYFILNNCLFSVVIMRSKHYLLLSHLIKKRKCKFVSVFHHVNDIWNEVSWLELKTYEI